MVALDIGTQARTSKIVTRVRTNLGSREDIAVNSDIGTRPRTLDIGTRARPCIVVT